MGRVLSVRRRGRPSKFGRPSRSVALTLPDDVLGALQAVDPDRGWAIVKLLGGQVATSERPQARADVGLLKIGAKRSLIVVNRATMPALPGVQVVPLNESHAFLALSAGCTMSDLELAVIDRLNGGTQVVARERRLLKTLRAELARWRRNRNLRVRIEAIIVLEDLGRDGRTS